MDGRWGSNRFGHLAPMILAMLLFFPQWDLALCSPHLKGRKSTNWNGRVRCSHQKLSILNGWKHGHRAHRRLLQAVEYSRLSGTSQAPSPPPSSSSSSVSNSMPPFSSISYPPISFAPSPSQSPSSSPLDFLIPSSSPAFATALTPQPSEKPPEVTQFHQFKSPSPASTVTSRRIETSSKPKHKVLIIYSGVIGGSLLICVSALVILCCRKNKGVTVKPWATGLSGQLQKAFVAGVPRLQRSELEMACEDFCNIIGTSSAGTVYKGTLSSGVEIAVASIAVKSAEKWSKNLGAKFRTKIDTLSKVNHKNFVNLIGYCKEDQPFTRMMVFEYAPNGTLFEHLHMKEADQLDWAARKRIAMGMAYCLEYMHQLNPPVAHRNLQSSYVFLTEDYAAKISDFSFWDDVFASEKKGSAYIDLLDTSTADPESNVYSFGVILFEMITGKIPDTVVNWSLLDWASNCLKGQKPLEEAVDPTLKSFEKEELQKLVEIVRDCVNHDPIQRPTMGEVTAKLKEITAMGPDGATPKLSPLWWAEVEILST